MVGETLKQRQKKHKKQSENPHAMGYFTKLGCGNCAVNNALFNASTRMGGGNGRPCAAADGGCGAAGATPASSGMGEDLEDRRNSMKINEDYTTELAGPWELGIEYHAWQTFDNGDGTATTRYTLSKPLTDEQLAALSDYTNVTYKQGGAKYKYAPEITYDLLYVTLPKDDVDYDYDDNMMTESKCCAAKEEPKKKVKKSDSMKWLEKYIQEGIDDDNEDDEDESDLMDFDGMAIHSEDYFNLDSEDPDYESEYSSPDSFYSDYDDSNDDDIERYGMRVDFLEDADGVLGGRYEEIDSKEIMDSDGFSTEYTLYHDLQTDAYFTIFGDRDLYAPDDMEDPESIADACFETIAEAQEWFDEYEGYTEDDFSGDPSFDNDDLDRSPVVDDDEILGEDAYYDMGKYDDNEDIVDNYGEFKDNNFVIDGYPGIEDEEDDYDDDEDISEGWEKDQWGNTERSKTFTGVNPNRKPVGMRGAMYDWMYDNCSALVSDNTEVFIGGNQIMLIPKGSNQLRQDLGISDEDARDMSRKLWNELIYQLKKILGMKLSIDNQNRTITIARNDFKKVAIRDGYYVDMHALRPNLTANGTLDPNAEIDPNTVSAAFQRAQGLSASLSKDEKKRKLKNEIDSIERELRLLSFDSDQYSDEPNEAIDALVKKLVVANAKYKDLTREDRLDEASKG